MIVPTAVRLLVAAAVATVAPVAATVAVPPAAAPSATVPSASPVVATVAARLEADPAPQQVVPGHLIRQAPGPIRIGKGISLFRPRQPDAADETTTAEPGVLRGRVSVAHANIPNRSPVSGYRATLAAMLAHDPDLITLNEQDGRSIDFIESAAPGYDAWRDETVDRSNPGHASQARNNVVLWKRDAFTLVDSGRTQIVDDDVSRFRGRLVTWDRFATWALLRRNSDQNLLSVVSVHHMTNPGKYGPHRPKRQRLYGRGMDTLLGLAGELRSHGPVFVAGDMNTHDEQQQAWTAVGKMTPAGYGYYNTGVDFIFYPQDSGIEMVDTAMGPTPEPDHRWIYARFRLGS